MIVGDIELDLRQAELSRGENIIRLSGVIGDMEVLLPSQLEFSVDGSVVLGDMHVRTDKRSGIAQHLSYQTAGYASAERKLKILASQVVGDIVII